MSCWRPLLSESDGLNGQVRFWRPRTKMLRAPPQREGGVRPTRGLGNTLEAGRKEKTVNEYSTIIMVRL
ncbi:unnamed protein product [Ectocarpus sp. 6 AP-2014]